MDMSDTILFESSEKFIQNIDWGNTEVPDEVGCLIKNNNSFRTRDLDNSLGEYMVSFEGSLKSQYFEEYEYVCDDDRPIRNCIKTKGEYWIDEHFSGKINIFPDNYIDFLDKDWDVLFELSFINGFLIKTKCVKCSGSSNIERKRNQNDVRQELINKYKYRRHFLSNKFIKIYVRYYVCPIMCLVSKLPTKYLKLRKAIKRALNIFVPLNDLF